MIKRKVVVIAIKTKYNSKPFFTPVVWSEKIHTYLTGQHIDPNDKSTEGNLSPDQMLGKAPLTDEQKKKFKYIIDPNEETLHTIYNKETLDISTDANGEPINHGDYAKYIWLCKYVPEVAPDKDSITSNHIFYIQDEGREAEIMVSKKTKTYLAMDVVYKTIGLDKLSDLALLLNYYKPSFNVDIRNTSTILLQNKMFEVCESNPEFVLKFKEKGVQEDLYFLKLAYYKIITKKDGSYYDGEQYLGTTLSDLKAFSSSSANESFNSKWSKLLLQNEKPGTGISDTDFDKTPVNDRYIKLVGECTSSLEKKNYKEAMGRYKLANMMNKNGKELPELKKKLALLKEEDETNKE